MTIRELLVAFGSRYLVPRARDTWVREYEILEARLEEDIFRLVVRGKIASLAGACPGMALTTSRKDIPAHHARPVPLDSIRPVGNERILVFVPTMPRDWDGLSFEADYRIRLGLWVNSENLPCYCHQFPLSLPMVASYWSGEELQQCAVVGPRELSAPLSLLGGINLNLQTGRWDPAAAQLVNCLCLTSPRAWNPPLAEGEGTAATPGAARMLGTRGVDTVRAECDESIAWFSRELGVPFPGRLVFATAVDFFPSRHAGLGCTIGCTPKTMNDGLRPLNIAADAFRKFFGIGIQLRGKGGGVVERGIALSAALRFLRATRPGLVQPGLKRIRKLSSLEARALASPRKALAGRPHRQAARLGLGLLDQVNSDQEFFRALGTVIADGWGKIQPVEEVRRRLAESWGPVL